MTPPEEKEAYGKDDTQHEASTEGALTEGPCQQDPEGVIQSYQLDFSGGSLDCTELLRSLIQHNISVLDFHPTQETLEDIFFKIGHQQSS